MRAAILTLPLLVFSVPTAAQSMDYMNMPGMQMPGMKMEPKSAAKPAGKKPEAAAAKKRTAAPRGPKTPSPAERPAKAGMSGMKGMSMGATPAAGSSAGHDMSATPGMSMGQSGSQGGQTMQGMDMSKPMQGHDMSSMPGMDMSQPMAGMKMGPTGQTKPVVGNVPPPEPPTDHAADRIYGPEAMRGSRGELRTDQGGQTFYMVLFNLAEYQFRNGRDGYRWDGEAWYGGDVNRLFVKTEGEGTFRQGVDSAEVQALYSRAIGPYFNLQAGVRQDLGPSPKRTYATIGFEGLAPGQFELSGAAFLSNNGDLLGRLEGYYDQRLTQRLILQPRAELNFAAQDVPENSIGSGLSNAELGLRLRYEIRREFAPYVGVSWDLKAGDTARFARAAGDDATTRSIVAGVRVWF